MRTLAPPTHRGALHWKGFFKLSTKLLKAVTLCCSKQSSEVEAHFRLAEFPTRAVEPQSFRVSSSEEGVVLLCP